MSDKNEQQKHLPAPGRPPHFAAALVSPLLLGIISIAMQIILMREFVAVFAGNELTIGFLLSAWLLWGGLGSLAASRWRASRERLARAFDAALLLIPPALAVLRLSRFVLGKPPGEALGLSASLFFAFLLSMLISFPLGSLFVLNVRFLGGNLARVYTLESLGAFLSGGLLYFLLIPHLSNWDSAAVLGFFAAAALAFFLRRKAVVPAAVMLCYALLALLDMPSQRLDWKPYELHRSVDSEYGKLQVLRMAELTHIYSNHHRIATIPDPASAEEAVHFTLLQNPEARRILLIGGPAEGSLDEVLKYPLARVDTVELDPRASRLSRAYGSRLQWDPARVKPHFSDGRSFLRKAGAGEYDVIICHLPEPATVQMNRYYTRQFFLLCRSRMKPGGVLSFRIPSAENYISPSLQNFLKTMYHTLGSVFREVDIVPGPTNVFLGSDEALVLDPEKLAERLKAARIRTQFIRPELLMSRLSPLRRQALLDAVTGGPPPSSLNEDLKPISFLYYSILWSTQFHGLESRFYRALIRLPRFWLMDFPLILFFVLLLSLILTRKRTALSLVPLAVLGLTTMITELVVLIVFQINCGALYSHISLLLTAFMGGLFLGSLEARRRNARPRHMVKLQAGFIALLGGIRLLLPLSPQAVIHFLFLGLLGFLGGELFITSNRLYLQRGKNPGLGYALDLLGSFLGALAAASILMPLFGLLRLVDLLLILNAGTLAFIVVGNRFYAAS